MIDNEIAQALECCVEDDCDKCPCDGEFGCIENIKQEAINLINRQKEELESLREIVFTDRSEAIKKDRAKVKVEAVKEFAERLICKIVNTPTTFESTYYMYRQGIAFRQNEIIDIIKEMAGKDV